MLILGEKVLADCHEPGNESGGKGLITKILLAGLVAG
jgi:hypothetical protein